MATAKLWWNGSSWQQSSCWWINSDKYGSYQLGITYRAKIYAEDDMTIHMQTQIAAWQTASIYNNVYWDGTETVKSGSTTIGTNQFNKAITQYSSISISGTLYAHGNASGVIYGSGGLSFSGSTNLASPFRTITYDVNQGTGSPGTQKFLYNISGKVTPAETPTRTSYTFKGWNTKADGSGTAYNNESTITITADTTLYAQWSQNEYTVTINADEGSTITFDGEEYSGVSGATTVRPAGSYPVTIRANDGFIIKTRDPAQDGNVTISNSSTVLLATSQHVGCRIDDGNDWVQALIYVDDGNDWVMCQAYYDDGNEWILLN